MSSSLMAALRIPTVDRRGPRALSLKRPIVALKLNLRRPGSFTGRNEDLGHDWLEQPNDKSSRQG